jgi:hypothetical protein
MHPAIGLTYVAVNFLMDLLYSVANLGSGSEVRVMTDKQIQITAAVITAFAAMIPGFLPQSA